MPISEFVTNGLLATNRLQVTNELLSGATPPVQATPTFSPVAGSYVGTQNVSITSSGADHIYYTTDGSTPTVLSTLYSGPVPVAVSETLKAIAVKSGNTNSLVGSAAYVITAPAAPSLKAHAKGAAFGASATTAAVDTTGATFLVVAGNAFTAGVMSISADTYNNTWHALTTYGVGFGIVTLFYCFNPVVGPGHTVTFNSSNDAGAAVSVEMAAFDSMDITAAVFEAGTDKGNHTAGPVTSQPGSVAAASMNDLIISALCSNGNSSPYTVDSGFTETDTNASFTSGTLAYLVAPDTSAVNPTWGNPSGQTMATAIAVFKHA